MTFLAGLLLALQSAPQIFGAVETVYNAVKNQLGPQDQASIEAALETAKTAANAAEQQLDLDAKS